MRRMRARCRRALQRPVLLTVLLTVLAGLPMSAAWAQNLPAAAPAAAEDLLAVYAQARAADPQRAAADAQRGVQHETAVQARAALLPQWQMDATDTRSQADGSRSNEVGSSLSQVLFDLGRLRTLDAERTLESAQDARVRAAEQSLCARVAQAYFGVLSAQAALSTAMTNEATYATQVSQAQTRFAAGLSAQVDVEQARAYHALSRGNTTQARQSLADAREALAQITGHAPGALRPLAEALPGLPPQPQDAQAWLDQALRNNPSLQALVLGLEAGQQRIAAARAGHAPTVSAGLSSSRLGGNGVADADRGRTSSLVALRLTVPLFAGGATESLVRQASHQRDALREDLETARRTLIRETQAQYQAVLAGVSLLDSTQAAVTAANNALASTRAGQNLGTRSMTDLLLAIQTQAAAQNAHDQARHAYVLARLLLQQAAGSLGIAELEAVNRLLKGSL
jgi:outer membrane protein